jgi:hypothetical protein
LENRHCFSVAPFNFQTVSISNATPEGQAAIWQREMEWVLKQAADTLTTAYSLY